MGDVEQDPTNHVGGPPVALDSPAAFPAVLDVAGLGG
jgi:hypothetical protein